LRQEKGGQTRQTTEQLKRKLEEIATERRLAQTQHLENMDNLKMPTGLQAYLQNKCQFYESMRRHELEVKNYMQSKIISLKEDIIQGQHKSATQRMLAIRASVTSTSTEWSVRI